MDEHFMKLLMVVITGHPSIPIVEHKDDQESEILQSGDHESLSLK